MKSSFYESYVKLVATFGATTEYLFITLRAETEMWII
nr:MAG TPA: hypothetical protein [Caudoviricetes sp.]